MSKYHFLDIPVSDQRIIYDEQGKMVCGMSLKNLDVWIVTGEQCPPDDAVAFALASHPGAWVQMALPNAVSEG